MDAETGRQKSPPKRVSAHRDKNPGNEWPEIPAETPYLASYRKRAVCGDWMVEVVGYKLATHPPVIEPVSAGKSGTEICDAETGTEKPAFLRLRFNIQSRVDAHSVDAGFFVP